MPLKPFISVIVPVWNSPDLIVKCLTSLEAQTYPRDRFEIIVVDNGSTDNTREAVARFPDCTLLSEPVPGSYRARNTGLAVAKGDYIAFTDADCVASPNWLEAAVAATQHTPGPHVYGGPIELFEVGTHTSPACEQHERLFAFNQLSHMRQGFFVGANLMCSREAVDSVDGFNATVKSGGDRDFCNRLRAKGYMLVYVPDMIIAHPVRASFEEIAQKRRRIVGGGWTRPPKGLTAPQLVYRETRRAASETVQMMMAKGIPPARRLAVLGVITRLWGSAMAEIVRLRLGGEASRA